MIFITLAIFVFWLSVGIIFYVYIGYPLLVYIISRLFPKQIKKGDFEPKVSIIITAYNEEQDIRGKIENTLAIDYPLEKLQIIVASDGSTDGTDEIVKEFAAKGVNLFRQDGRVGKTHTQNKAVEQADGEVILFSDATTMFQSDVLKALVPNFADQTVGCVAGRLIYVDESESGVGTGARSYWNYETSLKESESKACSLIGVSGCLYAVRRSAYMPMYPEACSDFLICTVVYRQGLRSVYEPGAVCTEETNRQSEKEMQMRVRVISQTFTDLWRNREMLNPLKSGFFAIELISHKLLRYSIPVFLFVLLLTTIFLAFSSDLFFILLVFQIVFYAIALIAWLLEKKGMKSGVLAMPLYFVLTNLASWVGFYKFLRGERYASWEPIREKS
ncbi:MAG: glycosyltransferase family 2 protein [Saprospiraceae bacterium]|nr:glycosyltransferase family 2 protein [Pyrinomonadaceae bacterium]